MKIAICFSRQTRYSEGFYFNFINNIIKCNPECIIDIYVHSWSNIIFNEDEQKEIFKKYNVKKYILENEIKFEKNFKYFDEDIYRKNHGKSSIDINPGGHQCYIDINDDGIKQTKYNALNQYYQFYSTKKAINLAIQSNINYDLYIRYRFDNLIENKIIFKNNIFNLCKNGEYNLLGHQDFLIANKENIEIYIKIYDYLDSHLEKYLKHCWAIIDDHMCKYSKNYNSNIRHTLFDNNYWFLPNDRLKWRYESEKKIVGNLKKHNI
jgi:hypothetical protein